METNLDKTLPALSKDRFQTSEVTIDTDNFLQYLEVASLRPDVKVVFKPLHLNSLKPFLQNMQQETHEVPRYSQKDLEKHQEIAKKWNLPALDTIEDSSMPKGPAERSEVVYLDRQADMYKITDIVHGDYHRVSPHHPELDDPNSLPLMSIHTHPEDALPSISDYSLLLQGDPSIGVRHNNALLVVCPSVQVLACVTPQTPVFTLEETKSVIESWMKEAEERTDEDFAQFLNQINRPDVENDDEAEQKQATALHLLKSKEHMKLNELCIEFARKMNIKLFISTNYEDFQEFTS